MMRLALDYFRRAIDLLANLLAAIAMLLLVFLVGCILYEVISRRFFNSPTLWAYDLSLMTNGSIFVLALAFVLSKNQHICIDFLSHRFSNKALAFRNLVFYGLLFLPVLSSLCYVAWATAIEAFQTGRVDRVSPWAPLIWPYLSALAIGLTALLLQVLNLLGLSLQALLYNAARSEDQS
jgi:TRAP-type mannitol/chloroaromatic compound transport system permease small subunit